MIPFLTGLATAGAFAAVLVVRHAVRRTAREDALWDSGWSAGHGAHAAEIEELIRTHGDGLTAANALDLADRGRDFKELHP